MTLTPLHIAKYKPYDFITVSRELILSSLVAEKTIFNTTHTAKKRSAVEQGLAKTANHAIMVFGEIEWLALNLAE